MASPSAPSGEREFRIEELLALCESLPPAVPNVEWEFHRSPWCPPYTVYVMAVKRLWDSLLLPSGPAPTAPYCIIATNDLTPDQQAAAMMMFFQRAAEAK